MHFHFKDLITQQNFFQAVSKGQLDLAEKETKDIIYSS